MSDTTTDTNLSDSVITRSFVDLGIPNDEQKLADTSGMIQAASPAKVTIADIIDEDDDESEREDGGENEELGGEGEGERVTDEQKREDHSSTEHLPEQTPVVPQHEIPQEHTPLQETTPKNVAHGMQQQEVIQENQQGSQ
jgi:hypothetical protein